MQSVRGRETRGSHEEKLFIVGDIWVRVLLPSLSLRKYPAGCCQHPSGSKEKEHRHVGDVFLEQLTSQHEACRGLHVPSRLGAENLLG